MCMSIICACAAYDNMCSANFGPAASGPVVLALVLAIDGHITRQWTLTSHGVILKLHVYT